MPLHVYEMFGRDFLLSSANTCQAARNYKDIRKQNTRRKENEEQNEKKMQKKLIDSINKINESMSSTFYGHIQNYFGMLQNNQLQCGEFIVAGHYLPIEIVLMFGANDKCPNECWSLRFYLDIKENIRDKIQERSKKELNTNTINRAIGLKVMYATMKCSYNLKCGCKCRVGVQTFNNDLRRDFITDFNFDSKNFKKKKCQIVTFDFVNQEILREIFENDNNKPLHQVEIIANELVDSQFPEKRKKEWIKSCFFLQGIKSL